jgi:hypothetical protein
MSPLNRQPAGRRWRPAIATPACLNEAPGPLFHYDDLNPDKRTFRLLRILPILERFSASTMKRLKDTPLWNSTCTLHRGETWASMPSSEVYIMQFELITSDFEDETVDTYDSLSYEWGPDEPPFHWIKVNNSYLRIRHNLHCFLQAAHISHLPGRSLIWVDAICINQDNISERGHQVKQMTDIYSRAKSVLAWLGPDVREEDYDVLLKLDEEAEEQLRANPKTKNGLYTGVDWYSIVYEVMRDVRHRRKVCLALIDICKRTYWTRMWIIQEILSAKEAWLILGSLRVSWQLIQNIVRYRDMYRIEILANPVLDIVDVLLTLVGRDYERQSICVTVGAFRQGMCSDSRDRVYAILGLFEGGGRFPVNYSITKEELFCSVVLASHSVMLGGKWVQDEVGTSPLVLSVPIGEFPIRRVDMGALVNISQVATALGVSFDRLIEYLATKPDLATGTFITLFAWIRLPDQSSDGTTHYRCAIKHGRSVPPFDIEIILSVQSDGEQQIHFESLLRSASEQHAPVYARASATFDGIFDIDTHTLTIPFQAFMFVVSNVYKVLNLDDEHQNVLEVHGDWELDMYGNQAMILQLDSLPSN